MCVCVKMDPIKKRKTPPSPLLPIIIKRSDRSSWTYTFSIDCKNLEFSFRFDCCVRTKISHMFILLQILSYLLHICIKKHKFGFAFEINKKHTWLMNFWMKRNENGNTSAACPIEVKIYEQKSFYVRVNICQK